MDFKHEYRILLKVKPTTRRRLDMVRMILDLQANGEKVGTWDNVVEWLTNMVPIPELLAELVAPQNTEAPKG